MSILPTTTLENPAKLEDYGGIIKEILYYYDLYARTWDEDIYMKLLKSINKYLGLLSPVPYIPGFATKLSENLLLPLWESRIDNRKLEKLLELALEVKYGICGENCEGKSKELSYILTGLLNDLSVEPVEINEICSDKTYSRECYVLAVVLTLVLSTNP